MSIAQKRIKIVMKICIMDNMGDQKQNLNMSYKDITETFNLIIRLIYNVLSKINLLQFCFNLYFIFFIGYNLYIIS